MVPRRIADLRHLCLTRSSSEAVVARFCYGSGYDDPHVRLRRSLRHALQPRCAREPLRGRRKSAGNGVALTLRPLDAERVRSTARDSRPPSNGLALGLGRMATRDNTAKSRSHHKLSDLHSWRNTRIFRGACVQLFPWAIRPRPAVTARRAGSAKRIRTDPGRMTTVQVRACRAPWRAARGGAAPRQRRSTPITGPT